MAIIRFRGLSRIRSLHKNQKIVYCSGTFDLTHAGHALFFEDCKRLGDVLVVGVGMDYTIKKLKGKFRPVLNHHLRVKMVDSLKPVDYSFLSGFFTKHPLGHLKMVFETLKPNVYAVNNDAFNPGFRKKISKKYGVRFVVLKRTCPSEFKKVSTSKIIEKIKAN